MCLMSLKLRGNGGLSELIIEQRKVLYEIVDPTYSGLTEERIIHKTFLKISNHLNWLRIH